MNLLFTILEIVLIISVVLTAIQEPQLSFKYGKELIKSTVKLVNWVVSQLSENDKISGNVGNVGNVDQSYRSTWEKYNEGVEKDTKVTKVTNMEVEEEKVVNEPKSTIIEVMKIKELAPKLFQVQGSNFVLD